MLKNHGACDIGIASLYVYQANKVVKTDPNDPYMKYYIEDLKITLTFFHFYHEINNKLKCI